MTRHQWMNVLCAAGLVVALLLPVGKLWGVAAVLLLWHAHVAAGIFFPQLQMFCRVYSHGDRTRKQVALTFDDGPDPCATPAVLAELAALNVPATFFLIGSKVDQHPELARQITEEGHLIANHTQHHRYTMNFLCGGRLRREVLLAERAIQRATRLRPRFFRPPVGLTNPDYSKLVKKTDTFIVGWEFRALDRRGKVDSIVQRVLRRTRPGTILVLHDGGQEPERICSIIKGIANGLRDKGFEFVALDELLGVPPYRDTGRGAQRPGAVAGIITEGTFQRGAEEPARRS